MIDLKANQKKQTSLAQLFYNLFLRYDVMSESNNHNRMR